jgi:hypothetical protein
MRNVRVSAATLSGVLCLFQAGTAYAEETGAASGSLTLSTEGASASGSSSTAGTSSTESPPEADTQANAPIDPRVKNPANYEFTFVSVAAYQTWGIVRDVLYFGAGGGLGPSLYRFGKTNKNDFGLDPDLEIAFANAFLRVKMTKYVDLDLGPRMGIGAALFNVPNAPQSSFTYGGYGDLAFGSPNIKAGMRFEFNRIAHSDYFESGWRVTPLFIRVVH